MTLKPRLFLLCLILTMTTRFAMAQLNAGWTEEEVCIANTAATCPYMEPVEKEVVLYINLMRLYPEKFIELEVSDSREKAALRALYERATEGRTLTVLTINRSETDGARRWAGRLGESGKVEHDLFGASRQYSCGGYFRGQNCVFGSNSGRKIVLEMLLDKHSIGDERNPLDALSHSVGVGLASHTKFKYCCVVNVSSYEEENYSPCPSAAQTSRRAPDDTEAAQPGASSRLQDFTINDRVAGSGSVAMPTQSNSSVTTQTPTAPTAPVVPVVSGTDNEEDTSRPARRASVFSRFYDYSGYNALHFFTIGYTYSFVDHRHLVNASLMDFRLACIGLSPLCAEVSVSPWDKRVAYKPSLRIYLPAAKCFAFVPYGGVALDASALGQYLVKGYDYDKDRDFYLSAVAGLAFHLSAAPYVPIELRVEYRHPIITPSGTNMYSQGVYLGAQLYFGKIWDRKI